MRRAVKKPSADKRTVIKRQYELSKKTPGVGISPKLSVNTVDHAKLRRAKRTERSARVGRFSQPHKPIAVTHEVKALPLAPAPEPAANHVVVHAEVPVKPHPQQHIAHPVREVREPAAPKKATLFEEALAHATSHQQPKHAHPKRSIADKFKKLQRLNHGRIASTLAALAAVVVIGGFITYVNKSSVQLQVASVRAGFQANMPSYVPEGYQKQPAQTSNGKVAINFVSPKDYSGFTLTQEPSSWDSQTLFDSVVAQSNSSFQTVQSKGRTIYIYGKNNAAWVDGGVLYKISGNAQLKGDQIIALAGSM